MPREIYSLREMPRIKGMKLLCIMKCHIPAISDVFMV